MGQYVVRANRIGDSTNPWQAEDIGVVGVPGYSSGVSGTYTLAGSGSDIGHGASTL